MYPAMMNPLDRDLPMRPVSRPPPDFLRVPHPPRRGPPIRGLWATDAPPRCRWMATAKRKMMGDATLEPVATPRLDLRHVLMRDRLSPIWCCARHGFGNRPGFGKDKAR